MNYVIGAEQIIANLNRASIGWLGLIADAVEKTCNDAEIHAKAGHESNSAHMSDRYQNQTSNLTKSISSGIAVARVDQVVGFIAANQEYAPAIEYATSIEFGTSEHPAYPFLFPALFHVQTSLMVRLKIALRSIV